MPAGSKTDSLLAKAKPIGDGGSTSGIMEFRREKNLLHNSNWKRGGGGAPGTGADIPLQPMVNTMVRKSVPL
ncbi:E3 ubiquitin-protein ligase MARCHF3 [Grus japonensis]|uniref:E3 ubiquitin-protein ligase MARCHF3 n=1 Tax=Grus japonensis TaxID=30415 RepID=A0ABC9XJH6_GRUJA